MDANKRSTDKKSTEGNIRNGITILSGKIDSARVYRKLKLQQEFMEKGLASLIEGMKIDAEVIREITDNEKKMSYERQIISQALERGALEVAEELKSLKSMVQQPDPARIQNLDISDFRSRLTKLSNRIEDFRRNKNLDKLKDEESIFNVDLRDSERLYFLVERPVKRTTKRVSDKKYSSVHRDESKDQFVEFVARFGHTQGWSEEDHSLFLKLRKKFNSVPQLVTEFRERRCHLTTEEVINHEAWYKLYSKLQDKRKKEIAEWRSNKRVLESTTTNNQGQNDDVEADVSRVKSSSVTVKKKENQKNKIDREKKTMLEEWKADRARKSAMDDEQKKRLEITRAEKDNRSREIARKKSIVKLKDYEEKNFANKYYSETNLRRNVEDHKNCDDKLNSNNWLIKSFREQDEKFLQRKLNLLAKASQKEDQKDFINKRVKTVLPRSRSLSTTLLAPTKVWEERCKVEKKTLKIFATINYVKDIQKLAARR